MKSCSFLWFRGMRQVASAVALMCAALAPNALGQIINNSATGETSEDSVTVAVLSLDSLGNPTGADSFFVAVFGGGKTNAPVFSDSGTASTLVGLDTLRLGGRTFYYYSRKSSDIDGAGAHGAYSGVIIAKSNALGLRTLAVFEFQIVGWELDDMGDSSGVAALNAKATRDTIDADFASLAPVVVKTIQNDVITDLSIANGAVDIDEFSGNLATAQFEPAVMTGALLDGSWKQAIWALDTGQVSAGFGQMLKNHAKAATTDSSSIARWVWNTPSANHAIAGSFGDYLDAPISGLGSGSGAYSVTVYARDTSRAQVVPGSVISVFNLPQTALFAVRGTDLLGKTSFNLNAGSYLVTTKAHGYFFPTFDTLIVSGALTDTVEGYAFNIGAPATPDLVRAYGHVRDIAGQPDPGATVSASIPTGVVRHNGVRISPFRISRTTDSTGYFFLDIIPSADLTPKTTKYEFTIHRTDGTILRKQLAAPDSATWRITW